MHLQLLAIMFRGMGYRLVEIDHVNEYVVMDYPCRLFSGRNTFFCSFFFLFILGLKDFVGHEMV